MYYFTTVLNLESSHYGSLTNFTIVTILKLFWTTVNRHLFEIWLARIKFLNSLFSFFKSSWKDTFRETALAVTLAIGAAAYFSPQAFLSSLGKGTCHAPPDLHDFDPCGLWSYFALWDRNSRISWIDVWILHTSASSATRPSPERILHTVTWRDTGKPASAVTSSLPYPGSLACTFCLLTFRLPTDLWFGSKFFNDFLKPIHDTNNFGSSDSSGTLEHPSSWFLSPGSLQLKEMSQPRWHHLICSRHCSVRNSSFQITRQDTCVRS